MPLADAQKHPLRASPSPHVSLLPTPRQLARDYWAGLLTRKQFQAAMSLHADDLIEEIEETRRDPLTSYLDSLLNRRAASRLLSRHSEVDLRRALVALSQVPGFPPANFLWNADHWEVPFACFLRVRREPVFRILDFGFHDGLQEIVITHGDARRGKGSKVHFLLGRAIDSSFVVVSQEGG